MRVGLEHDAGHRRRLQQVVEARRAADVAHVRIPVSRCTTLFRGVQRPLSLHALEAMDAALHEAQARADLEAERAHRLADGQRTAHRACGTVEGREEAVARRVNLPAAEAAQLQAYGGVVPLEQVAPGAVAELGGV